MLHWTCALALFLAVGHKVARTGLRSHHKLMQHTGVKNLWNVTAIAEVSS